MLVSFEFMMLVWTRIKRADLFVHFLYDFLVVFIISLHCGDGGSFGNRQGRPIGKINLLDIDMFLEEFRNLTEVERGRSFPKRVFEVVAGFAADSTIAQ